MSFDKGQDGVLVQMHSDKDKVALERMGEERVDPEEMESNDLTGIRRLEYVDLPVIGQLLQKWEMQAVYDLWKSNCQTMVRYIVDKVLEASNGVRLHLPGRRGRVSISDGPTLLSYFNNQFPGWERKELVRVPEQQIQYAIGIKSADNETGERNAKTKGKSVKAQVQARVKS